MRTTLAICANRGFDLSNRAENEFMLPEDQTQTPPPMPVSSFPPMPPPQSYETSMSGKINTNTYISVGLLLAFLGGFWAIINSIYSAKSEITTTQMQTRTELSGRQDRFEQRMDIFAEQMKAMQANRETWSYHDMFKWAVHLQRDNPQIKVPEPEADK